MREFLFFLIFSVIGITLQGTILNGIPASFAQIDFVWISVLFLSFFGPQVRNTFIVFLLGILVDTTSSPFPGLFTTVYMLSFLFVRLVFSRIYAETQVALMIWTFLITIFAKVIEIALLNQIGYGEYNIFLVWHMILQAVLNGLLGLLLYPFFMKQFIPAGRNKYVH